MKIIEIYQSDLFLLMIPVFMGGVIFALILGILFGRLK